MHPTIREIGYYKFCRGLYDYPIWQHVLILIALFAAVFFGSIMIDKIRIIISNGCYLQIEKLLKHIPEKWFKMETYLPRLSAKMSEN